MPTNAVFVSCDLSERQIAISLIEERSHMDIFSLLAGIRRDKRPQENCIHRHPFSNKAHPTDVDSLLHPAFA